MLADRSNANRSLKYDFHPERARDFSSRRRVAPLHLRSRTSRPRQHGSGLLSAPNRVDRGISASRHVRTAASLRRVFTYNAPRAMAVRGTVDQIAAAERVVKEMEPPR